MFYSSVVLLEKSERKQSNLVTVRPDDTMMTIMKRIFQIGRIEHVMMVSMLC